MNEKNPISGDKLPLTRYQITQINKGDSITLSFQQIKYIKTNGAFLPALPAILAAAPLIWNVAKGAYDSYQNKKANEKLVAEKKRFHDAIIAKSSPPQEGEGLYTNRKPKALGEGAKNRKPKGKGLYMHRKPKALGEGANVFKKTLEKLKKPIKYFWFGSFSWKI